MTLSALEAVPSNLRNDEWVWKVEAALRAEWSRESIIAWLQWNDPNGEYLDSFYLKKDEDGNPRELYPEEHPPLTFDEALELLVDSVWECRETPAEIRRTSRRP